MKSALSLIIGREYFERVRRKSFIITTLLVPILMVGLMALPTLLMLYSGNDSKTIAVVDRSGIVAPRLTKLANKDLTFRITDVPLDSLRDDESLDAILVVPADIVADQSDVRLYTRGANSLSVESILTSEIDEAVETARLDAYDIPDLRRIIDEVQVDVSINTYRLDKYEDADEATSSVLSLILGEGMAFLLYMFLIIYGQMVMNSIIEEKNNRVLELVVSSAKPTQLMLGKIIGVGLVAVTQVLIWGVLICAMSIFGLPALMAAAQTADAPTELGVALGKLADPSYIISLCMWLILFLIGGYLFFAAIFAAVGSAVDNVQDASQLTTLAMLPIIAGLMISITVINDPDSTMALWASIIPLTSPMVMLTRIPFGVPLWQILLSLGLLLATTWATVWFAAKIYRVGILMYGKKPNFAELLRWARYK